MTLKTDWPCWEIMKCKPEEAERCPAFKAQQPCWEVMREIDAFAFNICRDCIVFLVKQKDSIFSQDEIRSILHQKGINVTSNTIKCPQFRSSLPSQASAEIL